MASSSASSSTIIQSNDSVFQSSNGFQRSVSPSGRFSSSTFSSASSRFSPFSNDFLNRSVSNHKSVQSSSSSSVFDVKSGLESSVLLSGRFSAGSTKISALPRNQAVKKVKRTCLCSPTTHPGSFRCSLHKNMSVSNNSGSYSSSHRLNARRSAMTNSLVRIGTVEGEIVKRALAALIRPSSHQQRRRTAFEPRPSRLSIMSKAED